MRSLKILLKIGQRDLDQTILEKKKLSLTLEEKVGQLNQHLSEVEEEYKKYLNSEYAVFLENYLKGAKAKERQLSVLIESLSHQLEELDKKISEIFAELKRYEIIMANYKKRQLKKELEQETKLLDELTIIKVNNNNNS